MNIRDQRERLGLTQEELAMILGISRTEWTHFELNNRQLSTKGLVRWSQIENYITYSEMNASEEATLGKESEKSKIKLIEYELTTNQKQKYRCSKKIERTRMLYEASMRKLKVIEFLKLKQDNSNVLHDGAIIILEDSVNDVLKKNSYFKLLKLELQLKLLQHEEMLLNQMKTSLME